MRRILYLAISAVLTAFTLVVLGGVAGAYAAQSPAEPAAAADAPLPIEQPSATPTAQPTATEEASPTPSPTPDVPITSQMAALIAMAAAPNATLQGEPVLVMFEGRVAYEVQTDLGLIYIDANDGIVLFNGTIPKQIVLTEPAPDKPSGGPSYSDSEEHEEEDEDEDD